MTILKDYLGNICEVDLSIKEDLIKFPALVDLHVHFRTPGNENKEDWLHGAKAAVSSGVTYLFDMPNNTPSCTSVEALLEKKQLIEEQLSLAGIPLRYGLYFGVTRKNLSEISKVKDKIHGIKIFMGSSTGDLLVDDDQTLSKAFKIAAEENLQVLAHAEDESLIKENKAPLLSKKKPLKAFDHSLIRNDEVASKAVKRALLLSKKYQTRLHILHVSSLKELDLIRRAKNDGVKVTAEATPHHLFFSQDDYKKYETRLLVNPPVRSKEDQNELWRAINDGTIDTIGTDHAPHLLSEKDQPYGLAPSGLPSIEIYFSLLLNAYHEGKITLNKIVELTSINPKKILNLDANEDYVLVDLEKTKIVDRKDVVSKCAWSPYIGFKLKGWPVVTVLNNRAFFREKIKGEKYVVYSC